MAKLIVKAKYYDGKTHNMGGYLKYIATREGVEKIDESRKYLPATQKQQKLIAQLLQDFPDAKEMLEYEDFVSKPTLGSASEFITRVLEDNVMEIMDMDGTTYADYIATRPGVERFGKHGLFGNDGEAIDLEAVSQELNAYTGNVHTLIISLRREDAARLGFDAGTRWRDMLRTQTETLAKSYKIPMDNLRWYGAFHNEGKHPHVHVMVWAKQPGQAFLTEAGLKGLKSSLVHDIFHQDLACIYERQTEYRNILRQEAREQVADIAQQIAGYRNPKLESMLTQLSQTLQGYTGRAVYKYLPPETKLLVDDAVTELAKDERISSMFNLWYEQREEVLKLYHTKLPERLSLSECPEFLPIKNAVIREAAALGARIHSDAGDEAEQVPEDPRSTDARSSSKDTVQLDSDMEAYFDSLTHADPPPSGVDSEDVPSDWMPERTPDDDTDAQDMDEYLDSLENADAPPPQANEIPEDIPYRKLTEPDIPPSSFSRGRKNDSWWTDAYKEARNYLYGTKTVPPDPQKAFTLMSAVATTGNGFAIHDLGRMYLSGLGCCKDEAAAQEWFQKAYHAFLRKEQTAKKPDYLQYRIGKLFSFGYGVEQDFTQAAAWYEKAVEAGNPFAAYSLAGLYRRGEGVEQDDARAFSLYRMAAEDEKTLNAYAMYELGKMCRDGIGTAVDAEASAQWFQKAYQGFLKIEQSMPDEKLYYRLGEMNRTGTGTEINLSQAFAYYIKAAELGNVDAFYRVGKLYALGQGVPQDLTQVAAWYEKAVEAGNPFAAYSLAGLYRRGEGVAQDDARAFSLYRMAAEDEKTLNAYAMYELGKMCRDGIGTAVDAEASAQWFQKAAAALEQAAAQGDGYAQYRLGTLYLYDLKDSKKAMALLQASADSGNPHAQQLLEEIQQRNQIVAGNCILRLFYFAAKLLQEKNAENQQAIHRLDRKLRRKIMEKKIAQGLRLE